MPSPHELEEKFWSALKSDRVMMLGLANSGDGHAQPMTAILEDGGDQRRHGPIWFFTSSDVALAQAVGGGDGRAMAHFVSKGHDLFATLHGTLSLVSDQAKIDELWSAPVAAWFPQGRSDPSIRLLRLDADEAQIWLSEHSMFEGIKMLLGIGDPRESARDNVATVSV